MAKKKGSAPRRYVHIGFPKSASTSLQNFYFGQREDILHLGNGYNASGNSYIDEAVETVCEVDVRLKKEVLFDAKRSRAALTPHFDAAERDGRKAVGISSEFFCFPLGNEVDTADKARRLHRIMGEGTTAIIIVREQFSLLRSLYLEMVKGGYGGTYRKFLEYTLLYQVRSWCHDFAFHHLYELYADLFGADNVVLLPFETLKHEPAVFLGRLATSLGLPDDTTELRQVNQQSETKGFYEQLRRYNQRFPHEFGGLFYEPFNMNRMRSYFHNELELAVPHDRLADDFVRGPINQAAQRFNQISPLPDIDLNVPKAIEEHFEAIYAPSNAKLARYIDTDLAKLGYRVA